MLAAAYKKPATKLCNKWRHLLFVIVVRRLVGEVCVCYQVSGHQPTPLSRLLKGQKVTANFSLTMATHSVTPNGVLGEQGGSGTVRLNLGSEGERLEKHENGVDRGKLESPKSGGWNRVRLFRSHRGFSSSFGRNSGHDIRTIQELLGHKEVEATTIYTHVLNRGGRGVASPLDVIGARDLNMPRGRST